MNAVTEVYRDERGSVERTGLHEREFLDTFRVNTDSELPVRRNGSVHMMNLVEGRRALLVSTEGRFRPFELRYAETCIVPEAAGGIQNHLAGRGAGAGDNRVRQELAGGRGRGDASSEVQRPERGY